MRLEIHIRMPPPATLAHRLFIHDAGVSERDVVLLRHLAHLLVEVRVEPGVEDLDDRSSRMHEDHVRQLRAVNRHQQVRRRHDLQLLLERQTAELHHHRAVPQRAQPVEHLLLVRVVPSARTAPRDVRNLPRRRLIQRHGTVLIRRAPHLPRFTHSGERV